MINHQIIAKTGFYTSLVSYGVFWMAEWVRPGFVSFVFSLHVWLIPIFIFGMWWAYIWEGEKTRCVKSFVQKGTLVLLGIFLFIISWKVGEVLEGGRIFISLLVLVGPVIVFELLSEEQDSENMESYE